MKEIVAFNYRFIPVRTFEYMSENRDVVILQDGREGGFCVSYKGVETYSACLYVALLSLSVETGLSLFDMLYV